VLSLIKASIKRWLKIKAGGGGRGGIEAKMDYFHHFLFEGTPKHSYYSNMILRHEYEIQQQHNV